MAGLWPHGPVLGRLNAQVDRKVGFQRACRSAGPLLTDAFVQGEVWRVQTTPVNHLGLLSPLFDDPRR